MKYLILLLTLSSCSPCKRDYEMPDGAICRHINYKSPGFQRYYDGCTNGKTYYNPTTVREVIREGCE